LLKTEYAILKSVVNPLRKFHTLHGIQGFITVFARSRHWTVLRATLIQSSTSHCVYRHLILSPTYTQVSKAVSSLRGWLKRKQFTYSPCVLPVMPIPHPFFYQLIFLLISLFASSQNINTLHGSW